MTPDVALRHTLGDFHLDAAFHFGAEPGVTALFGASGAGKSTIIGALAGLVRPDFGRVTLQGVTLLDTEQNIWLAPHQRRIGVVFQDARLFPHMNVQANLLYGWRRADEKASQARVDATVALLGLEALLPRRPRTLSGGERSRVALARALLMNPRALLLDEPLAALDAQRKAEILPYLERLVRETKIPMLYVSHSLDEVARLADRMIVLDRGRVAAEGSVFDITARLDLLTGNHLVPGAVLEAVVLGHDETYGLTEIAFAGETLVVPGIARAKGDKVRIRIDPEDVMLALARPDRVSANNIFAATVAAVSQSGINADVQLKLKDTRLVVRITRRSLERLQLKEGAAVFAIIKSVTVGGREHG